MAAATRVSAALRASRAAGSEYVERPACRTGAVTAVASATSGAQRGPIVAAASAPTEAIARARKTAGTSSSPVQPPSHMPTESQAGVPMRNCGTTEIPSPWPCS